MATLQDLYDNIKELIHQKFETKTEEDTTLPQIVESYFNYYQGKLNVGRFHIKLEITGSSFSTSQYSSSPFSYNGRVFVDWGDNTKLIEYTSGQLSHSFTDGANNHTVKIYGHITNLGINCFRICTGLTSITIPQSVTNLESACFNGCSDLTSITIPDGVRSLGSSCFAFCSLTSIALPSSITSIGGSCFYGCSGLTSIILNWNTTNKILTYNSQWITDTNNNLKFIIPQGTTQLYIDKGYPSDKLLESD